MTDALLINLWSEVVANGNSWVLFQNGTCVIFPQDETAMIKDLRRVAKDRLASLEIQSLVVAELRGQGKGWCANCGDDFILTYVPHANPYESRYEWMMAARLCQQADQQQLKIIHVENKGGPRG